MTQKYRDDFNDMGIDIDYHIVDLDPETHRDLHRGKGCGHGGKWNKAWRDFFGSNSNPTKDDAFKHLQNLRDMFGI